MISVGILILVVILLGIILIITKMITNEKENNKDEKEISFNEFDDLEKIQQKKRDRKHIENENKALERIMREQEQYRMVQEEKRMREEERLTKLRNRITSDEEQIANGMIDSVNIVGEAINDTISSINKMVEDKEKRKKTKILDNFEADTENKIYEGSEINEISENYSNFNLELFKKWSKGIFLCIEIGEQEELEIIKDLILPEMYNMLIKNANKLKQDGLKLQREEIYIEEIKLIDYGKKINKEEIKILIKSQMKEYIMNIKNKKAVRGSKNRIKEKNILMTFHKKIDKLEEEGFVQNCQNCGAPIAQVEFGRCKYCESIVLPIRYNWTLVKFQTI